MGVRVVAVPALEDNYMYLLVDEATKLAAAVDPVDPARTMAAASAAGATLVCILTTHAHWDHDGGNPQLMADCPSVVKCYGGTGDGVKACTHEVGDGAEIVLGSSAVKVLATPCHTRGHVCYVVDGLEGEAGHVFTGDTLFVCGAGNFNNGTPAEMVAAFDKLLALPDETRVWVGHEYTCKNCNFAAFAEPGNADIREKLEWVGQQTAIHAGGRGTIPSTIGDERATNPFARIDTEAIKAFVGAFADRADRMRLVRKAKDDWGKGLRT
ncbi:beta-lactamase-like protein [Pelagophyceae sp. CCMP2097]|nr:beta-lactamase-like protein [Pelagophyceae sp. CCMP2097]